MNEHIFDWDNLRLFLAVARAGGLGAAANKTGKSAPTLGRRMLELERSLGSELFRRLPRGYELTDDGVDLLSKARSIEAQVLPLAAESEAKASALVKISAGTWVTSILTSAFDQLIGSTSVRLRFISSESVLDIGHRETAIGVRNQRPENPNLAGRRIGRVRFAVYAVDEDVATWARVLSNTPSAIWVKENSRNCRTIEVTAPQNALELANAGAARVVLPTFVGNAQPKLIRVTEVIEDINHDQWLVSHLSRTF